MADKAAFIKATTPNWGDKDWPSYGMDVSYLEDLGGWCLGISDYCNGVELFGPTPDDFRNAVMCFAGGLAEMYLEAHGINLAGDRKVTEWLAGNLNWEDLQS